MGFRSILDSKAHRLVRVDRDLYFFLIGSSGKDEYIYRLQPLTADHT